MLVEGMKIYIAGKIAGFDGYKERFAAAEKMLREKGALPMNPAVLPPGYEWEEYMQICFSMIDVCEAVYFLDNWKNSPGALKEFEHASRKGKILFYEQDQKADHKGCVYCKMLNKKIIEGPGRLFDNKPFLPFIGIIYNFKSEKGIGSKGLQAKFCPMCGTEVES